MAECNSVVVVMWLAQLPLTLSVMGSIPAAAYFIPSEFFAQICSVSA